MKIYKPVLLFHLPEISLVRPVRTTEGVGLIDNTSAMLLPFPVVKAELLLRERHQLDSKSFVEMRVWRVPRSVRASGHEFKYSLAYVVGRMRAALRQ